MSGETDCRIKEGHRWNSGGICVWCDALQEVRDSGVDLTGTVLDDRPITEDELRQLKKPSLNDLHVSYIKVAIDWLMWDRGMTVEEAKETMDKWPDHSRASEAVDVATFVVEVCHGR